MSNLIIDWLLEDNNAAIKYRTQVELLGEFADVNQAKEWIYCKIPKNWHETKGLWYTYYVTALAECGLSYHDVPIEHIQRALNNIENDFEYGCADFMLLRALIKLGFCEHKAIVGIIHKLQNESLPDGGFLCKRRLKSFKYTPKSCYKANIYGVMFLAECNKKNMDISFGKPLLDYFLNRNIFYKTTNKTELVMDGNDGWRIIDTFHPFEPMRIGIHNVVETFCALGYGNDEILNEAWNFLYKYKDDNDKIILSNTLTKSYLPKEKVGKASKWATFYTLLAEKHRTKQA